MLNMKLSIKKSGRFTYLYAVKGYRDDRGFSTSKVVRKFGTLEELKESLNGEDPIEWAQARVAEMTASRHTRTGKDGTKKWNCYSTFSSTFITICCFSLSKSTSTLSPSFMPVRMMSSAISSSIYF